MQIYFVYLTFTKKYDKYTVKFKKHDCKQPYSPYSYHLDPITNIVLHLIYYLSIELSNLLSILTFSVPQGCGHYYTPNLKLF